MPRYRPGVNVSVAIAGGRMPAMWCLTPAESDAWCAAGGFAVEPGGRPARHAGRFQVVVAVGRLAWSQLTWIGGFVGYSVEPFDQCLFRPTLTGAWPSSENWHLFYRLRESYGERRRLEDAPGHLFLAHERADLATFVAVALLCGWDFFLLPRPARTSAVAGHDGFLHLYTDDLAAAETAKASLARANIDFAVDVGAAGPSGSGG